MNKQSLFHTEIVIELLPLFSKSTVYILVENIGKESILKLGHFIKGSL